MGCTCEPLALRLPCGEARAGSEPHRRVEDPPEGRAPAQARSHLARCSGMSGAPEHPERRAHWDVCACVAHTEHTERALGRESSSIVCVALFGDGPHQHADCN